MKTEKELSESLLAACKVAGIENPKFIAQDKSGEVYHYNLKPLLIRFEFLFETGDEAEILDHDSYADDWRESLLEWVEPQANDGEDDACKVAFRKFNNEPYVSHSYATVYRRAWQDALKWSNENKP